MCKHGNGGAICVPKGLLERLGLRFGDYVVPEILPNGELLIRRPSVRDIMPARPLLVPSAAAPEST